MSSVRVEFHLCTINCRVTFSYVVFAMCVSVRNIEVRHNESPRLAVRNYYLRVFSTANVRVRDKRPSFRKVYVPAFRIVHDNRKMPKSDEFLSREHLYATPLGEFIVLKSIIIVKVFRQILV